MLAFCAFALLGIYHVCVTYPDVYNTLKMMAIFGVLQTQMIVEHSVNECKRLWNICESYVKKNIPREKLFSNEHILECYAISYCLNNDKITKIPFKFSKSMVDEGTIIPNDGFIVTEIKFDTLETVRLTYGYKTQYSMKQMWNLIETDFAGGYPTQLKNPYMCVEVVYDDNRYDVTGLLKEYLYPGNIILDKQFIRMFVSEHLGVYIKPTASFSLHTVDHDVNMNDVQFRVDEDDYSYEL